MIIKIIYLWPMKIHMLSHPFLLSTSPTPSRSLFSVCFIFVNPPPVLSLECVLSPAWGDFPSEYTAGGRLVDFITAHHSFQVKNKTGCRTWASALRKTGGVKNRAPLAVSLGAVARCRWLRNHRQGRGAG